MADITNVFKATVKTVKSRSKAQGLTVGPDKSILGKTKKQKSEFATKSKDVAGHITKLRDFLLEHRKDYISNTSNLGNEGSKMTDAERDQIDNDAQTFMRTCSEAIRNLRSEVPNGEDENSTSQTKEFREAVITLLEQYLKVVCKIYSEQKAIRVKRVVDRKRIGRLEPENSSKKKIRKEENPEESGSSSKKTDAESNSKSWQDRTALENTNQTGMPIDEPPIIFNDDYDDISPEEAQMFEQENQQLYEEMNSLIDEVKQVEGKVVEITRLQEIFTDKVLEQDKDVDRIADTVVGATENIKGANEEIREAMKNNAGLRVWILFFLIVCSFSLLFLDWYNP